VTGRTLPGSPDVRVWSVDLLALAGLLAAMVAANTEWLFNPFSWVDTWMYYGYFQHYDFATFLADNKKIARLPWILLGYLVNHATSPIAAQFILHLGVFAASAGALYFVLVRQSGRGIALITTAFYVTYLPAHGSGGWDYHNTPAAFVFLLTYMSIVTMTEQLDRPRRNAVITGILGAILLDINLLFALLVPALAWFVTGRVRRDLHGSGLREWTKQTLIGGLSGAVGVTAVLGVINLIVGREFLFFEKLLGRIGLLVFIEPEREKVWWRPWTHQWWYDSHVLPIDGFHMPLILTTLLMFALVLLVTFLRRTRLEQGQREVIGIFLIGAITFGLMQTIKHPLLQPAYMAYPLLLPTFMAIAALMDAMLSPVGGGANRLWGGLASIATCILFGALFVTLSATPGTWHFREFLPYDGRLSVIPVLSAFLLGLLVLRFPRQAPGWSGTAALGLMALAMAWTNAEWPSDPASREAYSYREQCRLRQPALAMIAEADRFLFQRVKAGNYLPLAYRRGENITIGDCELSLAEISRPLASMGYDVVMPYWKMETLPELPDDIVERTAHERTMITVITKDVTYRDNLLSRLRQRVPDWAVEGEMTIGGKAGGAKVTVLARPAPAGKTGG